MGQKTNPIGLRLGINKTWDANWFENDNLTAKIAEDLKLRSFVKHRHEKSHISRIEIARIAEQLRITIHTSRPGLIIGKGGAEINSLEGELKTLTSKDVKIIIKEDENAAAVAQLVADNIAQQLEGRISFRRALKHAVSEAMNKGRAVGVRVMTSGRLGGAEMARTEQYKEGRIPLHTLRAKIDYATSTAHTIYGAIGVKVWICTGDSYDKKQKK